MLVVQRFGERYFGLLREGMSDWGRKHELVGAEMHQIEAVRIDRSGYDAQVCTSIVWVQVICCLRLFPTSCMNCGDSCGFRHSHDLPSASLGALIRSQVDAEYGTDARCAQTKRESTRSRLLKK